MNPFNLNRPVDADQEPVETGLAEDTKKEPAGIIEQPTEKVAKPITIENTDNWQTDQDVPRLPASVKYTVITILVLAVALLAGRTIHHYTSSHKATPAAASTKQIPVSPPTSASSTIGSAASTTNSSSSSNQTAPLPNTGPGNTLAIFVGATAIAAVVHFALSTRRANRSRNRHRNN